VATGSQAPGRLEVNRAAAGCRSPCAQKHSSRQLLSAAGRDPMHAGAAALAHDHGEVQELWMRVEDL
jgi:hypothetical protein